jgi:hypothetical protein
MLYTLPNLAAALGVSYRVVQRLRANGFLKPHQCNGTREYYTMREYEAAAAASVAKSSQRATLTQTMQKNYKTHHNQPPTIDYDTIFKRSP